MRAERTFTRESTVMRSQQRFSSPTSGKSRRSPKEKMNRWEGRSMIKRKGRIIMMKMCWVVRIQIRDVIEHSMRAKPFIKEIIKGNIKKRFKGTICISVIPGKIIEKNTSNLKAKTKNRANKIISKPNNKTNTSKPTINSTNSNNTTKCTSNKTNARFPASNTALYLLATNTRTCTSGTSPTNFISIPL